MGNLTGLEAIGLVAILAFVLNTFFAFDLVITRKPFLQSLLRVEDPSSSVPPKLSAGSAETDTELMSQVLPATGVELPIVWGDLGKQMVASGVIDQKKLETLYQDRGGMSSDMKRMLVDSDNGRVKITQDNSNTVLNLLWALGLGNQNEILDKGEMQDAKYGGAANFASTGGWSLSAGKTMDHYSKHRFIKLTGEQQALVDRVSKNIFRPCCGNSTHFPDCNHGMAMLALLELMANQGVSEQDMYKAALVVNSYWFPNNYLTIASYFKKQGTEWNKVDPKVVLGSEYSSSQGYKQLLQRVDPQQVPQSKSGCGV